MDIQTYAAASLLALLIWFSLDFKKSYSFGTHELAFHPFSRFIAGLLVAYLATLNVTIASIALLIVFFWIADVNLLSFSLFNQSKNEPRA